MTGHHHASCSPSGTTSEHAPLGVRQRTDAGVHAGAGNGAVRAERRSRATGTRVFASADPGGDRAGLGDPDRAAASFVFEFVRCPRGRSSRGIVFHFGERCGIVNVPSSPVVATGQPSTRIVAFATGVSCSRPWNALPAARVRCITLALTPVTLTNVSSFRRSRHETRRRRPVWRLGSVPRSRLSRPSSSVTLGVPKNKLTRWRLHRLAAAATLPCAYTISGARWRPLPHRAR